MATGFDVLKRNKKITVFIAAALAVFFSGTQNASAAGELITADKTVFVQFAIFLAALYLLNLLFFKPLMELADRREKATSGSGKEADELAAKADEMQERYNAAIKNTRDEALAMRADLTKSASKEAEKIVSSAREEARMLLEESSRTLSSQIERAKSDMEPQIEKMAAAITRAVQGASLKDV